MSPRHPKPGADPTLELRDNTACFASNNECRISDQAGINARSPPYQTLGRRNGTFAPVSTRLASPGGQQHWLGWVGSYDLAHHKAKGTRSPRASPFQGKRKVLLVIVLALVLVIGIGIEQTSTRTRR